ncbi:MAG TPA: helix-turn-helix domain-containing protein [Actinophytocola sp.]|uniref:AraC-like ligand-binding domain-containing protein n=1 Tax=Actinophytocola sp. TaxID=1872138 RepID=UPI002DB7805C|nr:helix-turn-helix domain-containing protein [Actinophytocola sp.]HEU5473528.1 helix-turn-helix domain-containing protein [Actinophytocola sp.]
MASRSVVQNRTTDSGRPDRRFDRWREQVRDACGEALQVTVDRDAFASGTILTSAIGNFRISLISADPHAVFLSRRRASEDDGHVYVTAPLQGRAEVSQDGGHAVVTPGDVVTFDSSRSYALEMPEPFQMVALRFPHRLIGLNPGVTSKLTADPWPSTASLAVLVSQTLETLGTQLENWDPVVAEPLGATIGGLITTLFADRLRSGADHDPLAARQMLMLRVQTFARENLSDPALSPAMLAKRHNVSLRYLQVLFAAQGASPARWIRDERLAGLLADLNNPANDHLTVAALGERWGLVDGSQISRLFRQRYGLTPRDFRKLRQHGTEIADPHSVLPDCCG